MKQETVSPVMTLTEGQRIFGGRVSYTTIWKWARDGRLPTVVIGKKRFILREPFMAMLKAPSTQSKGCAA